MTQRNVVNSIPKSPCFRTPSESQSVHGCQAMLKPALQHCYPNFPLIKEKLIWKASLLVRSEILLHLETKDQLHNLNIFQFIDPEKCSYFKAWKNLFEETLPESTCWRVSNTAETCTATLLSEFSINLGQIELENTSPSQNRNPNGKRLTADHMYSHHRCEKFRQQVQMLLYKSQRTVSWNLIAFLEFTQNFAHFEKKDQLHSLNLGEVIEPEKGGQCNARKLLL